MSTEGHTHTITQVTNLQNTLNGKANTSHTHTSNQITDLTDVVTNIISETTFQSWKHIEFQIGYLQSRVNVGLTKMPMIVVLIQPGGNSGITRSIRFYIDDTTTLVLTQGEYSTVNQITVYVDSAIAEPPYLNVNMNTYSTTVTGIANILL